MCLRELMKNNQGFSLIEAMLAVAILALVTLPVINYFTYSGVRTADGRYKQLATVVAENVLDELNSYDNFEQIESIASNGAVSADEWTVVPDASNPSKFTYTDLIKKVHMDEMNYQAKVHITYTDHTANGKTYNTGYDSNTKAKDTNAALNTDYNDYKIPNPNQIYGKESVVAKEEDQKDQAVSHFMANEAANASYFKNVSDITSKLQSTIAIRIENGSSSDAFRVKVSYLYSLKNGGDLSPYSENDIFEVPLEISEVKKTTLENIFVFYYLTGKSDMLRLTLGTGLSDDDKQQIKKIKIYMCGMPTAAFSANDRETGYNFSLTGDSSAEAGNCCFFFNGKTDTTLTAKEEDGTYVEFVPKKTKKRIGAIEISVYEEGGSEPLAVMNTTISE